MSTDYACLSLDNERRIEMIEVHNLCVKLIKNGKTKGLQEKLDVFLAMDRLSANEYKKLVSMLNEKTQTF